MYLAQENEWSLYAEFPDLAAQAHAFPEWEFPNDCASRTVGFMARHFGLSTEEISTHIQWADKYVYIESDVIESLMPIVAYITMNTIPQNILINKKESDRDRELHER